MTIPAHGGGDQHPLAAALFKLPDRGHGSYPANPQSRVSQGADWQSMMALRLNRCPVVVSMVIDTLWMPGDGLNKSVK